MQIYTHPKTLPRSSDFQLRLNNHPIEVLATDVVDFAVCALALDDFPLQVEVTFIRLGAWSAPIVRPRARRISAETVGNVTYLTLERPEKLSVDFGNRTKPLYLFAQALETSPPPPDAPGVFTIPTGQITEIPMLTLEDGHTLYLPGGSVLKGRIHIKEKAGVRICGHGIFDGSFYSKEAGENIPSIILEDCPEALVEDITMVRPQSWMLVLAACARATVRNLKQIGEVISSDGIDIVGSSDVLIEDCFLHNNDDCVVIKALELGERNVSSTRLDGRYNVERVLVHRCTLANWTAGNAMEIGHELCVDHIRDIVFHDIDVLHVHGTGAVFAIHNNDRALISDIRFEDIRIEHCYDKLIDFRISRSRYSTDSERGRIRGVTLRNIFWTRSPYNLGYTVSMIGGWDADHDIADVTLENIQMDGWTVTDIDDLEICTRHCHGLRLIS